MRIKDESQLTPDVLRKKGTMKGFEYMTPERRETVREMESRFKIVVESFGFREIEGPLLQPVEFYQVKSGGELLTHIYSFEDIDGSLLVLRPELTPTVAYMIAKDDIRTSFPLRWWSNPDIFRKEKPQKGRKRQFKQLNIDIFDRADSSRIRAFDEAEIISVAISIFQSFGLKDEDVVMKINSRALVEKLFDLMELDNNQRMSLLLLIDRVGKISSEEFKTKLGEILPGQNSRELLQRWLSMRSLGEVADDQKLAVLAQSKEYGDLIKVFELLNLYGIPKFCEFSPFIVRGLDYYTGTVFEAFDRKTDYGFKRALMGGGRYDNLTRNMGGRLDITGVGFGFGNVPFEEILSSRKIEIASMKPHIDYVIVLQSVDQQADAIKISQELRRRGKRVVLDDSVSKERPDKVSKQLSRASQVNSRYSLIVFPNEWKEGKVVLKNMQTTEQKTVDLDSLLDTESEPH